MTIVDAERAPRELTAERSRVVTLTPAPAIDRVYVLDAMVLGAVNRAARVESYLAGKGINVAKTLHKSGNEIVAVAPMNLEDSLTLLEDPQLFRTVGVSASTRVNAVIVSGDGSTTNINQSAAPLDAEVWARLCAAAGSEIRRLSAHWLVVAGSMPARPGGGTLDPAPLFAEAARSGSRVCLDSGGASLRGWVDAGFAPALVKPNVHELSDTVGRPLRTIGDVVDAARELVDAGVATVLASLGGDGAVVVTRTHSLWARAPRAEVVNTTGAGDAALAGFLSEWTGDDPGQLAAALTRAVAWGHLAVGEVTPVLSRLRPVPGIEVGPPPLTLPLSEA